MSLREFIDKVDLKVIEDEVDITEIPLMIKKDPSPLLFNKVKGYDCRVVSGVCGSRTALASWFNVPKEELSAHIANAIDKAADYNIVDNGPCYEEEGSLSKIPMMKYYEKDGGNYIASAIVVTRDPDENRFNASYHRFKFIDDKHMAIRICDRHTQKCLNKAGGEMPVSIFIGHDPSVLIPGAISVEGLDEFKISSALGNGLEVAKCKTNDLVVPKDAEIVIEGRITKETAEEGPFVDISGTYDVVRQQPVVEVSGVWHRRDPIYHALLPGGPEHLLMMGMPKEPTIRREVGKVCDVRAVNLTLGGCWWLHGVVSIKKKAADDGKKAINAAFEGHKSMKHVVIVDEDIDVFDTNTVEWAIATRVQADEDVVMTKGPGSSIDPSTVGREIPGTDRRETCKTGVDATIPWGKDKAKFEKAFVIGEKQ